jgi:ferrous iron transport protein A
LLKTNFNFDREPEQASGGRLTAPEDADATGAGRRDRPRAPDRQLPATPPALEHLSELAPGCDAVVHSVDAGGPIGRRLLDLGLLPGTPVRALRRAPLGDPAVFELRGYRLCLRSSESSRIRLRPRGTPPPRS